MRQWTIRRSLAACALMVVATAGVAGCSDSDDSAAAGTTTVKASAAAATTAAAAAASDATTKAITDTYVSFFDATNSPTERAALVENGDAFLAPLEGMAANPNGGQTSATVSAVTMTGADTANVTYTILMGGAPVLPDQNGQAVNVNGQWKVSATTFCALLAIQGGADSNPACQ